jgi:predicted nucleic acid-binding Zn ribbon protein
MSKNVIWHPGVRHTHCVRRKPRARCVVCGEPMAAGTLRTETNCHDQCRPIWNQRRERAVCTCDGERHVVRIPVFNTDQCGYCGRPFAEQLTPR